MTKHHATAPSTTTAVTTPRGEDRSLRAGVKAAVAASLPALAPYG